MNDILKKLSSYNLFNYLLPGTVFALVASSTTNYEFMKPELVTGAFFYYFLGLVISRIGSIIVEPMLKWLSIVKFQPYAEFLKAAAKDKKLEILSEANNTFRTLSALALSLLVLTFWAKLESIWSILPDWTPTIVLIGLTILLLFSYQKQTGYIFSRIEVVNATQMRPSKKSRAKKSQ